MYQFKNKIQLIGSVRNPKTEVSENGFMTASFYIVTKDAFLTDKGTKYTREMNHLCVATSKIATIVEKFITEGCEIAVEGSLIQPQENLLLVSTPYIQVSDLLILGRK